MEPQVPEISPSRALRNGSWKETINLPPDIVLGWVGGVVLGWVGCTIDLQVEGGFPLPDVEEVLVGLVAGVLGYFELLFGGIGCALSL